MDRCLFLEDLANMDVEIEFVFFNKKKKKLLRGMFVSIELNAHFMVLLLLKLKEK
jgi:hypothetical protein